MRATAGRWLVLTLVGLSAMPSRVEAGSRRRVRRGGSGALAWAGAPTRSDESVQAVLAATPAGGTALLPSGSFRAALVIDRPMTLIGDVRGTRLDAAGLGHPAIEVLSGVSDVTIDGIAISSSSVDGLRVGADSARITVRRVTISGSAGFGLEIGGATDVTVDLCTFDGNARGGIEIAAKRARLARLSFHVNGGAQARLAGEDIELSDSTFGGGPIGLSFAGLRDAAFRCAFRDVAVPARFEATSDTCTFSRADVRGARSLAIAEDGSIYGSILENRVAGTSADAIQLAGSWHTVARNVLAGIQGTGVVGAGESLRVQENTITDATGDGVRLDGTGNMVDGNLIQSPAGLGVRVRGDACIVALNTLLGARSGGVAVAGLMNRVVGNQVRSARGVGIEIAGDSNTLQDDVVDAATGVGIRVASGTGNLLQANSILHCAGRGLDDQGTGTILDRNRIE